ncbi:MAG: hypothetical protein ACRDRR_14085, partial [Pseudonocardiaceae bacterium]
MAITELRVHGHDVARALEVDLPLPKQVCQYTLTRVFPWVPRDLGTPEVLLLAVTGRATVHGIPSDPEWWWQSAPLARVSGLVRSWVPFLLVMGGVDVRWVYDLSARCGVPSGGGRR